MNYFYLGIRFKKNISKRNRIIEKISKTKNKDEMVKY